MVVSGESGDVRGDTVQSWKERLPELLHGFKKENIWNLDETGCFWKTLPDRGFGQKEKECKGGKKSKQRLTVACIANAAGGKEVAVVIGRAENPRCFRGVNKSHLPVRYYSQKKAWMSAEILDKILTTINHKLSSTNRFILLFMDNAGCHPEEFKNRYSNIKIVFLPPNTTSKLQPLDLGIIQNFKTHYRSLLLKYVLTKIDQCNSASEVVRSVDILTAIRWVARAWESVSPETISKCFQKAGILNKEMEVVTRGIEDDFDPFDDLDTERQLQDLITRTMPTAEACTADEYINGDNIVPVCVEYDDDTWEDSFFAGIGESSQAIEDEEDVHDGDEESLDISLAPPKIRSFQEAIQALEEVKHFLDSCGCIARATQASSLVDDLASLNTCATKQTSILS